MDIDDINILVKYLSNLPMKEYKKKFTFLGEGIANICYVINPEVVVLGGGIMAQEQFLKERVECAVKRYLVSSIEEHTKIVFAKHQNDAGMLGAFYHFCSLH